MWILKFQLNNLKCIFIHDSLLCLNIQKDAYTNAWGYNKKQTVLPNNVKHCIFEPKMHSNCYQPTLKLPISHIICQFPQQNNYNNF